MITFVRQLCLVTVLMSLPLAVLATESHLDATGVDFSHSAANLHITKGTPEHTAISLATSCVAVRDTLVNYERYQLFSVSGEPLIYQYGLPALPQITRLYRIPNTGSADVALSDSAFDLLDEVNALPIQPDEGTFERDLQKDGSVYDHDAWYPPRPVVVSRPMILRDFRVVQVTLYPVQVNPVTHQARVYRNLSVDLLANDQPGENELLNPGQPSGAFREIYRSTIANLDDNSLDDVSGTPGSYLMILRNTSTDLTSWVDTLATWKRRMGYTVNVQARASWSATDIVNAVSDAYHNSVPPLEYVLLVGSPGAGTTSSFYLPTGSGTYDHAFACPGGTDILEDVAVGRLPIRLASDIPVVFKKLLAYERTPYMADTTWFHRGFFYAGNGSQISSNEIAMLWAKQQFTNYTGVNMDTVATHSGSVNNNLIWAQLNRGDAFFLWRGSVVGEMQNTAATGTNNGSKLPVVLTITCGTGDFTDGSADVSESWILAGSTSTPRGGICGIGTATLGTHVQYNNTVAGGLAYSIADLGIQHVGPALMSAKAQLSADFPTDSYANNFVYWNNLMGDPGLAMWTDCPRFSRVTFPGTVNVGARRINVQVTDSTTGQPVADALVVLWKDTETFARQLTDVNGVAEIPVTVNSPGTMRITVVQHNRVPYLADINCITSPLQVSAATYSLDDDNIGGTSGNSDGRLNPGEVIDLPVYLRNFGTSDAAPAVSAVMSSNNPHVTVTTASATFGTIQPGDSSLGSVPFRIAVSPVMKRGEEVTLSITATTGAIVTQSAFRLACRAGDVIYLNQYITGGNGNGRLDTSETALIRLDIQNVGEITLNGVTGVLRSNSSFISVQNTIGTFGSMQPNITRTNSGSEFTITANPMTYPGYRAPMELILSSTEGFVDTVRFAVTVGLISTTDPTGPDAYGYFAYDNTDVRYEMHREFAWDSINAVGLGENLNLNDPGIQAPISPTYSTVRDLPFPFMFYGRTYNQITICSNGWAAFGDQHLIDMFRNYPIPGQQAPDAMIAPFWDDLKTSTGNLGVWARSETDQHRYVIQWKAQGAQDTQPQEFEILLLNPAEYPTRDGNGIVVVQYRRVADIQGPNNDINYATVGIQAPGGAVGLQYRFNNVAAPGAANLASSRSIVFTTESRAAFGGITGTVIDAETQLPVPGVLVSIQNHNYSDTTDASGHYHLPNILVGTYNLCAHKAGFNDAVTQDVVVLLDSTITQDISILHPELALSVDHIAITLPDNPNETSFNIRNDGNGPLDYSIRVTYAQTQTGLDDPWNYLAGIDLSAATSDQQIWGCEFARDRWWITGGNNGGMNRFIYRFDLNGNLVDTLPQPPCGQPGMLDMAFDGNLVYGSAGHYLVGMDDNGVVRDSILSPCNPTRGAAYDPQSGHFWVSDYTPPIYEIDRGGHIVHQFSKGGAITGLAWNPSDASGYKLYVFTMDTTNQHALVYHMHPGTGDLNYLSRIDRETGDRAGGCTITPAWNSTLMVFAGILQGANGMDRLGIWELDFNTTWISVAPASGAISAGQSMDVDLRFNPASLRNATYHVNLVISNNTAVSTVTLPVALTVNMSAVNPQQSVVTDYALYQNYPNPFNSSTMIRYDLKKAGWTSLRVYNLLGQEVATLANGVQEAGPHALRLDMPDLASGVYLYRLESGDFRQTSKLMLIR